MAFATKEGDTITIASDVLTGISIIENKGMLSLKCKEWRARTDGVRTLAELYLHLRKSEKEFK